MAKYYGDIPCVKLNGIVHITRCATECLCGEKWSYSRPSNREDFQTENIIWRNLNAVTCEIWHRGPYDHYCTFNNMLFGNNCRYAYHFGNLWHSHSYKKYIWDKM